MRASLLGSLVFGILGIYLIGDAVIDFAAASARYFQDSDRPAMPYILKFIVQTLIGCTFVYLRTQLSHKLVGFEDEIPSTFSATDLFGVLLAVLGVFFFCDSFPYLVRLVLAFTLDIDGLSLGFAASMITKSILGIVLFVHGLRKLRKAKRSDKQPG